MVCAALALFLLAPGFAISGQSDRGAVEAVIETWNEGWRTRDAALAAQG